MTVTWETPDKVHVELEAIEYQNLVIFLTQLQVFYREHPNFLLDRIHADMYEGMDGRNTLKQVERKQKQGGVNP